MAYLGIDYGTKRIGVAVSSEDDSLAFPLKIVATGKEAVKEIIDIARERGVHKIVMGESLDFNGKPNTVMKAIEAFATELKVEGFEIVLEPEFLTSAAASRIDAINAPTSRLRRTAEMKEATQKHLDASAAALILQTYLDRNRNKE
jgi:putative holliday junction resolvase